MRQCTANMNRRCSSSPELHHLRRRLTHMRFLLTIYLDQTLFQALPTDEADAMMRDCLAHADELRRAGRLLDSQMLDEVPTAKTVRVRRGKQTILDGPFAETKEVLGGFNLV